MNWNRGLLQKLGGSISNDVVSPFGDVGGGFGGSSLSSMIPSSDPKKEWMVKMKENTFVPSNLS